MSEATNNSLPETDDDIDGCECSADEAEMTPDEDLPGATGGVS